MSYLVVVEFTFWQVKATRPWSGCANRICLWAALMSKDSACQSPPVDLVVNVLRTSAIVGSTIVSGSLQCWLTLQQELSNTSLGALPGAWTTLSLPMPSCGHLAWASGIPPLISSTHPCLISSWTSDWVSSGFVDAPAQLVSRIMSGSRDSSKASCLRGQIVEGGIGSIAPVGTPAWRWGWSVVSGSLIQCANCCNSPSRKFCPGAMSHCGVHPCSCPQLSRSCLSGLSSVSDSGGASCCCWRCFRTLSCSPFSHRWSICCGAVETCLSCVVSSNLLLGHVWRVSKWLLPRRGCSIGCASHSDDLSEGFGQWCWVFRGLGTKPGAHICLDPCKGWVFRTTTAPWRKFGYFGGVGAKQPWLPEVHSPIAGCHVGAMCLPILEHFNVFLQQECHCCWRSLPSYQSSISKGCWEKLPPSIVDLLLFFQVGFLLRCQRFSAIGLWRRSQGSWPIGLQLEPAVFFAGWCCPHASHKAVPSGMQEHFEAVVIQYVKA